MGKALDLATNQELSLIRSILLSIIFAGLVVNLGSSEYECLPNAGQVASKGPGGNDMSIGANMGALIGLAIGLRLVAFAILKLQFKLKNL